MNQKVDFSTLDKSLTPSGIMSYVTPVIEQRGNLLVVGYLADDEDCEDPLRSCDGDGRIYNAHRNAGKDSHSAMQDALGLDSDWAPELKTDGVWTRTADGLMPAINKALGSNVSLLFPLIRGMKECWDCAAGESVIEHAKNLLKKGFCEGDETAWELTQTLSGRSSGISDDLVSVVATLWEEVVGSEYISDHWKQSWDDLRSEGKVGDPHAVLLDCYEHGGIMWSISGGGTQCRWDTASGGGVWVPDTSAREEILRRAQAYAYGVVSNNGSWTRGSGKKRCFAVLDDAVHTTSPDFMEWREAFDWLEAQDKVGNLPNPRRGEERAARELAGSVLETYNDWLAGACYCVVVDTFQNISAAGDDAEWERIDEDSCGGYIGSDYAAEAMESEVKAACRPAMAA
jgi:hypothetical protein